MRWNFIKQTFRQYNTVDSNSGQMWWNFIDDMREALATHDSNSGQMWWNFISARDGSLHPYLKPNNFFPVTPSEQL